MKRGYTLTELLVVVTIIVILVAATLPIAKRVMDNSRAQDSARIAAGHFQAAKTYAARNNRPFGVWLELDQPPGLTARQCTKLYFAEVQAPYGGGVFPSHAIMRREPNPVSSPAKFVPLVEVFYIDANGDGRWDDDANGDGVPDPADVNGDGMIDENPGEKALLLSLIDDGERFLVKFDAKGEWWICHRTGSDLIFDLANVSGSVSTPHQWNNGKYVGHSFQVLRSPRRSGQPVELISGTCIDLAFSGMGQSGTEFASPSNRIVVMFSPKGGIDGLTLDTVTTGPMGTVHFLFGDTDRLGVPIIPGSNLEDVNSVWTSIARQTGRITTAANLPPATITAVPTYIATCREGAIQ